MRSDCDLLLRDGEEINYPQGLCWLALSAELPGGSVMSLVGVANVVSLVFADVERISLSDVTCRLIASLRQPQVSALGG